MKHPLAYLLFIALAITILPACDFIIPSDTSETPDIAALPENLTPAGVHI